ncbi:MAG TPA: DEDD exonuclease domain-containing protein [Acidimicrobiia bacterium]
MFSRMEVVYQASFDELSTPLYDVTFCVFDIETTGGSPVDCSITEIGAVKYKGGEEIGSFQTLVDPGMPIPPFITILTGITQAMVYGAPRIESVLPAFLEFIGDSVLVGHNIRFDLSFISAEANRLGYPPPTNKTVDTVGLARRLLGSETRNLRLGTLAAHFRSPVDPIHRALEDAKATAHVLHCLLERAGTIGVTNLDDLLALPRARGSAHYSKIRLTEHLPRQPGVYLFKDRDGQVIYVGKATNLRARVRQYFYGDTRRRITDLIRELDSIDFVVCESPLEAEITELRTIHANRPRYNRRSRPPKSPHFVKVTNEKYPRLSVVRRHDPDALATLGPFRSKRAADQVVMAIWDAIPIRRCSGRPGSRSGKCAGGQIGVARCPCDGSMTPEEYASVVDMVVRGIEAEPELLLGPLVDRMGRYATEQRYEQAAWMRDRHDALARALENRRMWNALAGAGLLEVEDESGRLVVIDHGVLVETRSLDQGPSLWARPAAIRPPTVPPTVEAAEEAALIWRWLHRATTRIRDCTGSLVSPATPIRRLVA